MIQPVSGNQNMPLSVETRLETCLIQSVFCLFSDHAYHLQRKASPTTDAPSAQSVDVETT